MIDVESFQKLKKRVEGARAEKDRAEGALDQLKVRLKKVFDVETIEEANKLLEKFEAEESAASKDYEEKLKVFQDKWDENL